MHFRYERFDPRLARRERRLDELRRLFHHLLLQTNDVDEALRWLERIAERYGLFDDDLGSEDLRRWLERQEAIRRTPAGFELTHRGERAIRQESLDAIFSSLGRDAGGDHRVPAAGAGIERLPETRAWRFGDPFSQVEPGASLRNALRRGGPEELALTEADLEVYETEHLSSCATVLLVDISHSMVLYGEDRITPAKRVALALCELIRTRYPKDALHVVTFGDEAEEVPLESLPWISVGPFHTNTRAGLALARDLLVRSKRANRQIFMVTDGKPSALTERDGTIYRNPFGLDRRVVAKTLEEADACRRAGIEVTTFMLTDDPVLVEFVDELTRVSHGRAYFSRPDRLGSYLLVDWVRNRRRPMR